LSAVLRESPASAGVDLGAREHDRTTARRRATAGRSSSVIGHDRRQQSLPQQTGSAWSAPLTALLTPLSERW